MLPECLSTANTGRNDPEHAVRDQVNHPGDCWPSFPPGATSGRRSTGELGPPAGVTKQLIPQDPEHRSRVTREEPHPKIFSAPQEPNVLTRETRPLRA